MKRCSTRAKRSEERSWLAEPSRTMLQQSVRDLSQAFKNWWKGKGRVRSPRFKSRRNRQSMGVCGREFYPTDRGVRFPKIGELKLRWSRPLPSPPTSVTIVRECSGKYYASFVVEAEEAKLPWTSQGGRSRPGPGIPRRHLWRRKDSPSQVPAFCAQADREVTAEPEPEGERFR